MVKKEDSVHENNQSLLHSGKWTKRLTIILASALLLAIVGMGGYWLGARQQQPSPKSFSITEPVQQLSPSPTISFKPTSTSNPTTANWETYRDPQGFFSIKYPLDPRIKVQYMKESGPKGLLTNAVIRRSFEPGSQLDSIGTFYLSLSVIDNVNHVTTDERRQAILHGPCANTLKPYRNGEIDGLYYTGCSNNYRQETIVHMTESKIYQFTFNTEGEPTSDGTSTFIDQIISTFKFNSQ